MQRNGISGVTSKHFMTCRKRESDFLFQSRLLISVLRQKTLRVKVTKLIVFVGPAIKYFSVFMHVPPNSMAEREKLSQGSRYCNSNKNVGDISKKLYLILL